MLARTTSARVSLAVSAMIVALGTSSLGAQSTPASQHAHNTTGPSDRWLSGLTSAHKQFFDMDTPNGGVPLLHITNYYDTYNKAYNVKDADIDAVLTFYGATTLYGVNDVAWARYRIGELLETNDATTSKPSVRNPWRTAPVISGMAMAPVSIESLARRGVTFILCNNALEFFAGMIATKQNLDPKVVYNDLKANILPEVQLVPAMVIAVEQAQRAGLTYHRQ